MLNQLPEIAAPHPPHILKTFEPLLPIYGNLNENANFESLIHDVCMWIELNPVTWQSSKFDRIRIKNSCKGNTLIELLYRVYSYYAELQNSEYTCCKSMSNVHQYSDLKAAGLNPRYIYLHRDGRDVACSFKKAIVGEKHVYHIARQWKSDQEKSMEVEQNIPSDRFINVKYRDLITNPESVLKNICSFLNVPFNQNMLDYFHAEESLKTARSGKMWQNLSQPIMAWNYNKYLKELTAQEIRVFEIVAGETLERLGYTVTSDYKNAVEIEEHDIEAYSLQNRLMKKEAVLMADPHDIEARYPQKEMLNMLNRKLVYSNRFCHKLTL
ncbi:MAG: sulfotransferase [Bacteroidales bacterium]|nr:sulfotransferase [Bacteroidales bacterium]